MIMNLYNELNAYYENYDEDGRLRSRAGSVEFLTTMRYIKKYIAPGARVIEIGAGTGRYSHALAGAGYEVDAVELIPHNIEIFRENTQPGEIVTVTKGDARDLSSFETESYDRTLLLGPMYHLMTEEDQISALSEAVRVTKRGGVLFVSYCNTDATMVQFCFGRGMITKEPYTSLVDRDTFKAYSTPEELFQLYRREDIEALTARFPLQRLHYIGTDMATKFIQDTVNEMDDETFDLYLRYHFTICERPDMVGATHHMLDVLRKV